MARILVVDDDPAVAEFVRRALAGAGYTAVQAPDAFAALDRLAKESFDLLLTDVAMPEMDGIALALKVVKEYPAMKVLLMSGYPEHRERAHNLDELIAGVLAKPFSIEDLTAAVKAALATAG